MKVESIFVQIEKLVLDQRRTAALAEENRWVRHLTALCQEKGTLEPGDVADFINRMAVTREANN